MIFPRKPFTGRHGPVLLALLMLALMLGLSHLLWRNASDTIERDMRADFDFRVRETVERLQQRMDAYRQVLRGARGFLQGAIVPRRDAFRDYMSSLRLQEHYPGIQAVGIAELVQPAQLQAHLAGLRAEGFPDYAIQPEGEREIYTAIRQIEPFNEMNRRAFGYDMYSDPVRRSAMAQARDSGTAALSSKVTLVQEAAHGAQPGFLMYLPVYRKGMALDSIEQRRAALAGWVYAPFRSYDLMQGLGGERSSELDLRIYDGDAAVEAACLYGCAGKPAADDPHALRALRRIDIAGHPWLLDIRSTPLLQARLASDRPRIVRAAGIACSLLLAALVWALASGRSRAVALASEMTRELRDSEFRWKFALEGAGDGLWDWDYRSGQIFYSRRWKEMLGYAENELSSRVADLLGMLHPDDRERTLASVTGHLEDRTHSYACEYRMRCSDGSWKWILTRGMAVSRDAAGKPLRIIGTHTDISERKEAERREAERLQALEQARTALFHAQKLEAVGQLTGGVAHDFNNVLQIIGGNLELLLREPGTGAAQRQRLQNALAAMERGSRLSSQLLAFARKQALQPMVIHIGRLVANMDALLRRALGGGISIKTTVDQHLWPTLVDPWQLENVIINLAINARDAMQENGRLTIELGNATLGQADVAAYPELPAGEYVMLAISDTGSGMTPAVMEQAFEPFFTTKPEGKGTGLGLSMAYGFIRQSGGHIRIYSEEGHGSTIRIYLPRSHGQEQALPAASDKAAIELPGGDETVLVVEDDGGVRDAVVATLTQLGYRVLQAADGAAALALLEGGASADLLFSDVVMPGPVRSTELAQRARQLLPGIAVLYTSGYTRNAIVHGGRLDADVELLSKPYRREQLARKLRQLLDARKADESGASSSAAARRILVVEDDPDLRAMTAELLGMIGHQPHCVDDAETALDALASQDFDWLFTDFSLPGMDGIELARQATRMRPGIGVVLASGYGNALPERDEHMIVLKKPYDLTQLRELFAS
jgi:PAS domain S-box-containing protein